MIIPIIRARDFQKKELTDNLKDLLSDIESDKIPYIRRVEELEVA